MGRHVNSVSLNRSIKAAYQLSIYTLGSCILPFCVSFKGSLLFFCPLCLQYYLHFPFLMLMNRTWRFFWVSKRRKLGKTWNTEQKISPKYRVTSQYGILIMRSIGRPPPPSHPSSLLPEMQKKKNTFPTSIIYGHLCKADNWFCPFALRIKEV